MTDNVVANITDIYPGHIVTKDYDYSEAISTAPGGLVISQENMDAAKVLSLVGAFIDGSVSQLKERVRTRFTSMEQYVDENEREWMVLDAMVRSRPWATRRDEPFPYPFRLATDEMRKSGEKFSGDHDGENVVPWDQSRDQDMACEVLVNVHSVAEFPAARRILLFTPEFGMDTSFDMSAWGQVEPVGQTDIWVVCWQGWSDWSALIEEVGRRIMSFADAVSTVWFGHGMGAIVAYEVLKLMEDIQTPNFPVALIVSGCPAPHLFSQEYKPYEKYPWLGQAQRVYNLDALNETQRAILYKQFSLNLDRLTTGQLRSVINDMKLMKSYACRSRNYSMYLPIVAFRSEEDDLVDMAQVKAWADCTSAGFETVDFQEEDLLGNYGHGYAKKPPKKLIEKVTAISEQYKRKDRSEDELPDIGPTDGPLPKKVPRVIVGGGVTGILFGKAFSENETDFIILDKYHAIGGIWKYYANVFSRVNTSEVGYRIWEPKDKKGWRPNEDHSPTSDIMRDIHSNANVHCRGKIRLGWEVKKCEKMEKTDGYVITAKNVNTGEECKVETEHVAWACNRRLGKRRDVVYPNEDLFRGDIVYGYANEVTPLKFWGKRVIIVGAGAFAFENLRTAMEHGAKHVTILGRRSGSTCPKWIDMIAFTRVTDENHYTSKVGDAISFGTWRQCYEDAGLPTPECWTEGLLKPHNHTVSVSDLVFIGGYHGCCSLKVGLIKKFRMDGTGVTLADGTDLDVDIVIKATGFHINEDVAKCTGEDKMYGHNLITHQMSYVAEPLLDGAQFGSSTKGRVDSSELLNQENDLILHTMFATGAMRQLPVWWQKLMIPKGNAFGSGYAGSAEGLTRYVAWVSKHPELQKNLHEILGSQKLATVKTWASQMGITLHEEKKAVIAKLGKDNSIVEKAKELQTMIEAGGKDGE